MTRTLPGAQKQMRAFTIVELLVVVTVVLILLAISIRSTLTFNTHGHSDAAAHEVAGALREAHARTLAGANDEGYGVHIATTSVTLFQGSTYDGAASSNDVRPFYRAEVESISLSDGSAEVRFARLRGTASATGTISVIQTGNASNVRTIHIHETGLVEIQ